MAKTTKKTAARSKPKAAVSASAKRAKPAKKKVAAKRQTQTAVKQKTVLKAAAPKKVAASIVSPVDDVMAVSAEAMQKFMRQAGIKSPMSQNEFNAMGKKSAEQMAKSADAATRSVNDMVDISKKNADAAVKCGDIAVSASKNIGAEMFSFANRSFSQNVELSKELFSCRTLNDMFDLHSKMLKSNMDDFFSESVKMSEMVFQCASDVSEPINQCVSETTERMSKKLSEAA